MLSLVLTLALSVCASAVSQPPESSASVKRVEAALKRINKQQEACHDAARSNVEMVQCEYNSYKSADRLLNTEYQLIVKSLKDAADGYELEYNAEVLKCLVAAQRAWIAYRDANCSLEATDMLGGSGENLIYIGCQSRSTKDRVLELVTLLGN